MIGTWRDHYKRIRAQSALGYRSPHPVTGDSNVGWPCAEPGECGRGLLFTFHHDDRGIGTGAVSSASKLKSIRGSGNALQRHSLRPPTAGGS